MQRRALDIAILGLVCFICISCQFVEKLIDDKKKVRAEITTKSYSKDGFSFTHPDNWTITEDAIQEGDIRVVDAEDADNSLFIISLVSKDNTFDLDEQVQYFKKGFGKNLPIGKVEGMVASNISRVINGTERSGRRLKFAISLMGEKVPHTTDMFVIEGEKLNALVTLQAPEEDWAAAEKEFQVMLDSLRF